MDYFLFQQINSLAGHWSWLDNTAIFLAEYFQYILIISAVYFFSRVRNWLGLAAAGGAMIFSRFVLVELIRFFYYRPRPFLDHSISQLIPHDLTASFPSGHAALFFALAAMIFFYHKKIGSFFLAGAFLIGLARILAGVHYPSDILVGVLVGFFSGWLVFWLVRGRFVRRAT